MTGPLPVDLVTAAACRIRLVQRLLCVVDPACGLSFDPQDINGLYYLLEDIYVPLTEAARQMEASAG